MNNKQTIPHDYTITTFDIVFDPIELFNRPKEQQKESLRIRDLLYTDPKKALQQLLVLIEKYPNDPILAGYLTNAYQLTDNDDMEYQTIIKNYEKFPHYLFARCAYAQLCLEEDRLEDAVNAIDNTFNLKELYPERSTFHAAEVFTLNAFCIKYFCIIGKFDYADIYLNMLKKIDDEHPSIEILENYYFVHLLQHNFKKLFHSKPKRRMSIRKRTIKNKAKSV